MVLSDASFGCPSGRADRAVPPVLTGCAGTPPHLCVLAEPTHAHDPENLVHRHARGRSRLDPGPRTAAGPRHPRPRTCRGETPVETARRIPPGTPGGGA